VQKCGFQFLYRLKEYWTSQQIDSDVVMAWAAAVVCFFGFFCAGEITVPTATSFDSIKHLAWGDVTIDSVECPKIHLKNPK